MLSGVSRCLTLCSKEGSGDVLAPRQLKGGGSEKGFDPWWALVGFGGLWWALVGFGGLGGLGGPPSDMFVVLV